MKVPNEPLRKTFLDSGMTFPEVAKKCGWVHTDSRRSSGTKPDVTRVKRTLGLISNANRHTGETYVYHNVEEKTALQLCKAMNVRFSSLYPDEKEQIICKCGEVLAEYDDDGMCGFCKLGMPVST